MARQRSIVVRLRAEVSDFQSQMGNAARSLSDFEREQQKMGGAAQTTMGRLVQSARINEREWQTVGRTLAVTGGAMAAVGAAALKTGIDYNSLRQTATMALEGITGSAEGAAEQMRLLDEYGSQSWIERGVLVRAQQNMTGFGIETGKVIPYMDALAEAVAGTTGSVQNFEELSRLMGQIESQGKITARELNQFGLRGIDAAQLIGDAMGKTANQIRDEITAGTLDAGDALDALAEGMATNFEGSSDRMLDTWDGALGNLYAAWRDLSSELAKPLVNPEGGGMLVDFVNTLADAMLRFRDAPGWVKGVVGALGTLATVATVGGGAFMLAIPKIDQYRTSVQTLANTHPLVGKISSALGKLSTAAAIGAGIAVTAGAFIKLADVLSDSGIPANADRITAALAEVNGLDIDTLFLDATAGAYDLNDAMAHLMDLPFGHEWGMGVADTLGITSNSALNARDTFEELDSMLVGMVQSGDTERAAQMFELLYGELDQTKYSVEDLEAMFPGYIDALDAVTGEAELAAEASDELAGSFLGIGDSAEDAAVAMENWIELVATAGDSFGGILDAYDRVIEKQGETSASTTQTMEDWIAELQAQAEAHSNWAENVVAAMEQANTEMTGEAQEMHAAFVEEMTEAGIEGAAALQTFVDATPEQRAELVEAWMGTKDDIRDVIEAGDDPQIGIEADTEPAVESVGDLVEHVLGQTPFVDVEADTTEADNEFTAMLREWAETSTETNLDADTSPADASGRELFNAWVTSTTHTNLDANTAPADEEFLGLTNGWNSATTNTNLDANVSPADSAFIGITSGWRATTTDTNLDANTSPASSGFSTVTGTWRNTTTSTKIDADTSPAQSAWSRFRNGIGTIYTSIVASVTGGNYHGGWVNPGLHEGGTVQPGLNAGGRVPGQRAGYDNVLWPLHSGGQILSQPLEGGEFVVRSSQAHRYENELYAMNSGTYPTGGMERLYSSNAAGPMSVQVSAPPVDTAAIGAAVASAIRSYQPVVQIGGRQFAGVMQEVQQQYVSRR